MTDTNTVKMDTDNKVEDLIQQNLLQATSSEQEMTITMSNEGLEIGIAYDADTDKEMKESTDMPHDFDMVLQLKMVEELQLMRTELLGLRINCMVIKDDIRENTMLTKRLWETLMRTEGEIQSPTLHQRAESNIAEDENK